MNKLGAKIFHGPKCPPLPATSPPSNAASAAIKSFNSIINRLSSQGAHHEVFLTYTSMLTSNTLPDSFTYPSLIKACTSLKLFSLGILFHQRVVIEGFSSDPYIASSLITFYSRFGSTVYAQKVFDMMPVKNIVPWTAIIGCYSQAGAVDFAFFMHNKMQHEGMKPSSITILAMLSGVFQSIQVECLHSCVVKFGFDDNVVLNNSMLSVYGKCGSVREAKKLFEFMNNRDLVSWNSLISAYAFAGNVTEILRLLYRMRLAGTEPDQQTFTSFVPVIAKEGNIRLGKLVHGQMKIAGFESNVFVETALMAMYLKYGNVDEALRIFERLRDKDVVSWTAMISGLVQNERADMALGVFRQMLMSGVMPSSTTIASALAACAHLGTAKLGHSVHGFVIRKRMALDIPSQNALVTMYAKCGCLQRGFSVFNMMEERDVVSWNAIVAANAQNGNLGQALSFFNEMRAALQKPDSITVVSLLQACASIGAYQQGKWIHNFVIRSCLGPCIMIDTALVDMYSKCGDLDTAGKCFDQMQQHDLVSWSTIIAGYGSHGEGEKALEMYSRFLNDGFKPNPVIFLSILYACSHNGLVDEGLSLFESMEKDFRIKPEIEHRGCIIDLLCRAGRVEDAYDFYKRLFPEPFVDALGIILDACRTKKNAELADVIAEEISLLKPVDPGKYVQLANSYASMANWEGVGEAWVQMRSLGLKKTPGWSFIELHGTITTFFRGHVNHSQCEDIMLVLKILSKEIRELAFSPDQQDLFVDSEVTYNMDLHSRRLQ
ncbi:hypothetical protein M9H77_13370 [Catharanthus roseus]|uniref:Uncharacterized protein n=1 Tax=Catharanthus roseus TaxID=4058 RepID=A0ACC0BK15_CATRO|nr:hypothetical protein M9H77_13370 [Catharanthus roseus]